MHDYDVVFEKARIKKKGNSKHGIRFFWYKKVSSVGRLIGFVLQKFSLKLIFKT